MEKENSFKENLKVEGIDEKLRLMELKRKYDNGEILEKDMTHDEMEALTKMYQEETKTIYNGIKNKEDKIAKILMQQKIEKKKKALKG